MIIKPNYLQEQLAQYANVKRWWLGFSGGLDSQVLLNLAVAAGLHQSHQLQVLHIHHGLQQEADHWAQECQRWCQQLQLPFHLHRVAVSQQASPEAMAREARYRVFESLIGEDDGLLLAHHQDDQAETLLFRLMRGSGPRGLASIPESRAIGGGVLARPLLSLSRQQLESYAQQHKLQWIDDPSNNFLEFDRNYLRHQVLPSIKQRWPHAIEAISRSARFCHESDLLNQQLAELDLQRCGINGQLQCLEVEALIPARQRNLIRYWLRLAGLSAPEERVMDQLILQLLGSRQDAEPCVSWGRVQVRRFQQRLYQVDSRWQAPACRTEWDLNRPLDFEFGKLSILRDIGDGVRITAEQQVEIGFRQGGERIKLSGRGGSRSLKKLLQDAQIPPWLRSLLPLVYVDGELAAVANLWIAEDYQAVASEPSIKFVWDAVFSASHDCGK